MMPKPCKGPRERALRTSISNVPWSRSAFGLLTMILQTEKGEVGSARPRISRLAYHNLSSLECQGFIDLSDLQPLSSQCGTMIEAKRVSLIASIISIFRGRQSAWHT